MQPDQLRRVEEDLAALKAALGDDRPYDRSHVAMHLLAAAGGLPLVVLPLLGLGAHVRPAVLAFVGLTVVGWGVQIRHLRGRRAEAPGLWRWGRREAVGALVASALLVGYVVWAAAVGRGRGEWGMRAAADLTSGILFCLGTFVAAWVAAVRRPWPNLGWAAALAGAGLLLPLCDGRDDFFLVTGGMLLAGGVSSGLLKLWQVRRDEVAHAD